MFKEALTQIVRKLEDAKKSGFLRGYGLIGGLALAAGGVTRATEDIDFAVATGSSEMPKLASAVGGHYRPGGGDDPLLGVINAAVAVGAKTLPVQLVLLPHRWHEVLLAQVRVVPVHGCSVPVVSWQALVLLKLYAGGPQDLVDARDLWTVHQPNAQAVREMESLAVSLGLSGEFKAFLQRVTS